MKTASHATQQRQPVFSLMNTLLDSLALANKVSAWNYFHQSKTYPQLHSSNMNLREIT
jgi:hypothetical protein